jgi:hypothetical protein
MADGRWWSRSRRWRVRRVTSTSLGSIPVMNCFVHDDRPALGICVSCNRGLCHECAADLPSGLACRDRCEDRVRRIADYLNRSIELSPAAFASLRSVKRQRVIAAMILLALGVVALALGYVEFAQYDEVGPFFFWGVVMSLLGVISLLFAVRFPGKDNCAPGHCRKCDYDLTGNRSGTCPECGTPFRL